MTTLTTTEFAGVGDYREVTLEVRFTKRSWGGWEIERADNGRNLGWLTRHTEPGEDTTGWDAHISSSAFRGDGPDDPGNVLDTVPTYLHHGHGNSMESAPCAYGRTRQEAAEELLFELVRHHAPAVGFGRHYEVRRYADR